MTLLSSQGMVICQQIHSIACKRELRRMANLCGPDLAVLMEYLVRAYRDAQYVGPGGGVFASRTHVEKNTLVADRRARSRFELLEELGLIQVRRGERVNNAKSRGVQRMPNEIVLSKEFLALFDKGAKKADAKAFLNLCFDEFEAGDTRLMGGAAEAKPEVTPFELAEAIAERKKTKEAEDLRKREEKSKRKAFRERVDGVIGAAAQVWERSQALQGFVTKPVWAEVDPQAPPLVKNERKVFAHLLEQYEPFEVFWCWMLYCAKPVEYKNGKRVFDFDRAWVQNAPANRTPTFFLRHFESILKEVRRLMSSLGAADEPSDFVKLWFDRSSAVYREETEAQEHCMAISRDRGLADGSRSEVPGSWEEARRMLQERAKKKEAERL